VLAISEKIPGLVWVAGDFHFGAVARVDPPGGAHFAQTEVLVGPVAHVKPALAVVQLTGDPAQFVPVDQRRAQLAELPARAIGVRSALGAVGLAGALVDARDDAATVIGAAGIIADRQHIGAAGRFLRRGDRL